MSQSVQTHASGVLRDTSNPESGCDRSATESDRQPSCSGVNLRNCQNTDFRVSSSTMQTSAIYTNGWGSIGRGFDSLHPLQPCNDKGLRRFLPKSNNKSNNNSVLVRAVRQRDFCRAFEIWPRSIHRFLDAIRPRKAPTRRGGVGEKANAEARLLGIFNDAQEPPLNLHFHPGLPPVGWDGRSLQSLLKYSRTRVDLSAISDSVMPARLQRHVMAHSPR